MHFSPREGVRKCTDAIVNSLRTLETDWARGRLLSRSREGAPPQLARFLAARFKQSDRGE